MKSGFFYRFEYLSPDGDVLDEQIAHNLIPDQGVTYMLNASVLGGSQFSSWYCGLFEGAYAPQSSDTATTFPGLSTEITAYSETTRQLIVPDAIAGGLYINGASPCVFTFTSAKTVRGAFLVSSGVKGGTTGILLSAVLAPSPKIVAIGEMLRVSKGFSLSSV